MLKILSKKLVYYHFKYLYKIIKLKYINQKCQIDSFWNLPLVILKIKKKLSIDY